MLPINRGSSLIPPYERYSDQHLHSTATPKSRLTTCTSFVLLSRQWRLLLMATGMALATRMYTLRSVQSTILLHRTAQRSPHLRETGRLPSSLGVEDERESRTACETDTPS